MDVTQHDGNSHTKWFYGFKLFVNLNRFMHTFYIKYLIVVSNIIRIHTLTFTKLRFCISTHIKCSRERTKERERGRWRRRVFKITLRKANYNIGFRSTLAHANNTCFRRCQFNTHTHTNI